MADTSYLYQFFTYSLIKRYIKKEINQTIFLKQTFVNFKTKPICYIKRIIFTNTMPHAHENLTFSLPKIYHMLTTFSYVYSRSLKKNAKTSRRSPLQAA